MPDLDDLLERTSRTFALAIPRLPDPTCHEVTVAYLLFRIADTFEDTTRWPRTRRIEALRAFRRLVQADGDLDAEALAERWDSDIPLEHDGYRDLLRNTSFVMDEFRDLRTEARDQIGSHLGRTARGMAEYVGRTGEDGELRLTGLDDLRQYCYVVAGIVGEMLTELFLLGRGDLSSVAPTLRDRSRAFGEGLQLVNVLKDTRKDVDAGRVYIASDVSRDEVFRLARDDLDRAAEYILALQRAGAEPGLVAFNALPVRMARATLDVVEEGGPGSKISRSTVWSIVEDVERDLAEERPVIEVSD